MKIFFLKHFYSPNEKGQSLLELIIAIGAFSVIISSISYLVLDAFSSNRQGEELTRATALMQQGYEAALSIRNQGWDNLSTGNHGIDDAGSFWVFLGELNQNIDGKYDRVVNVDQIDSDTKKILTTISWEYIPGQTTQVQGVAYLTSWQESEVPTPTPTPTPVSCNEYCLNLGYSGGICRQAPGKCSDNNEVYISGGDIYCPGTGGQKSCCCQ